MENRSANETQGSNASSTELGESAFDVWVAHIAIVEIIISVAILAANGLIITAYGQDQKLRTVANFFLVNLVIADFLVGVGLPVHVSTFLLPPIYISANVCMLRLLSIGRWAISMRWSSIAVHLYYANSV